MTLKKLFGKIHLILGLASGLVVFIICITAAIWAFSPEIENLTQPYRHVVPQSKAWLAPSQLQAIAFKQLDGKKVNRISFAAKDDAAVADAYGDDYYYTVFLNPYSGEVLKVKDNYKDFFTLVITGHYTLWLGEVGGQIVKWGTLVFLLMLISGIVLWWPRNKAARKQRYKIKFGTSPKRLNYDLHNVLGFYGSWIILFAALTGIVWTFDWASKAAYFIASGGETEIEYSEPLSAKTTAAPVAVNEIDKLFINIRRQYNGKTGMMSVEFPETDSAAIGFSVYPEKDVYYNGDNFYFDQYTLKEIPVAVYGKYKDANTGEKLSRMNYDIHIGSIAGWPGRVAMFLAVIIGASLPVTGFYVWWGRKKKTKPALAGNKQILKEYFNRKQSLKAEKLQG